MLLEPHFIDAVFGQLMRINTMNCFIEQPLRARFAGKPYCKPSKELQLEKRGTEIGETKSKILKQTQEKAHE